MYESFFKFAARPFLASPIADRYYAAAAIEHARESITRCLDGGQGLAIVLGPAGTGKSTLCQVLAQQMRDRFQVATLSSARLCTRRALLQNILFELKLPYRDREEGELRLSLIDHLEPSDECPHGMLLLVDEAHTLPLRLLEEIRMLTNLVRDGQPRVRVVLAAGLVLDERLASPRLESFNQRIAARCYLQSMSRDETCGYVRAQINAVGGEPEQVFTPDALQAIYRATDGIPRLVNQLSDHVLILAAIGRRAPIGAPGVEEAWADLQQLPSPWTCNDAADGVAESGAILEFGELDDDFPGTLEGDEATVDTGNHKVPADVHQMTTHLNQIETGIAAISRDDAPLDNADIDRAETESAEIDVERESQYRPTDNRQPEIELVFHHAHNPFSERFEQEEVIVDPFASLASLSGSPGGQPSLDHSSSTIPFHATETPTDGERRVAPQGHVALPVLDGVKNANRSAMHNTVEHLDPLPGDDRDLLEIQEELDDADRKCAIALPQQPPRRREYRQLFANLRRK